MVSGEYIFLEIDQPETGISYGGHVSCMISTTYGNFVQDLPYKVTIFLISANQKQELTMATMLLSYQDEMRKSYRGPSTDSSYKILLYLA